MRGSILGVAGARGLAWARQHVWLAVVVVIALAALLVWAGYRVVTERIARSHMRAASEALDRREWSEARTHLSACLRTWPDSPEAHLLAARAARRLELLNEASEHLDECKRLEGRETRAWQVEHALLRVHLGDLAGTEAFLREAVAQDDPDSVEILDVLAAALILDHRGPEAHRCLDELLRRRGDDFDVLVRHAETAERQGWNDVAAGSLQKAVDLRPGASSARLSLAQKLIVIGRHADALKHLEYLREEDPDNPAVVFALARCLAWKGQKQQAAKLLDGLLANEPDNPTVLSERGWLCLELDRPAEAEPYLRRAHSLAAPNQVLLTRLANCLRLLGKHDEARRYREEAERLRADTVRSLLLAHRIREEKPTTPGPYYELARLHLRLGQDAEALHYFNKALTKDPNHRPTHEALTQFYTRTGNFAKAAQHRLRSQGPGVRKQQQGSRDTPP
jgi:tetratricopeptide (TPR) repeat protein